MENTSIYASNEIELLKIWKAKAGGWRWLHYRSMALYKKINTNFTYASIILSTVAGAGGFSTAGAQTKNELEMTDNIATLSLRCCRDINLTLQNGFLAFISIYHGCELISRKF